MRLCGRLLPRHFRRCSPFFSNCFHHPIACPTKCILVQSISSRAVSPLSSDSKYIWRLVEQESGIGMHPSDTLTSRRIRALDLLVCRLLHAPHFQMKWVEGMREAYIDVCWSGESTGYAQGSSKCLVCIRYFVSFRKYKCMFVLRCGRIWSERSVFDECSHWGWSLFRNI